VNLNQQLLKQAVRLNEKYRMIQMDLDQVKTDEDILFQVRTEMDSIVFDQNDWLLEELEDEGKSDRQIERMKETALKHLNSFLGKWEGE
jgi:hypothetical protein